MRLYSCPTFFCLAVSSIRIHFTTLGVHNLHDTVPTEIECSFCAVRGAVSECKQAICNLASGRSYTRPSDISSSHRAGIGGTREQEQRSELQPAACETVGHDYIRNVDQDTPNANHGHASI